MPVTKISDEALDELIAICEEEFEERLTRDEATELGHRLVTLYELLSRRLPKDVATQQADASSAAEQPRLPVEPRT